MRLLLHPAYRLRVLSLPQNGPSGGLQLPVLLLSAVCPGRTMRRRLHLYGNRLQGLLRLHAAPCAEKLRLYHGQVRRDHGPGSQKRGKSRIINQNNPTLNQVAKHIRLLSLKHLKNNGIMSLLILNNIENYLLELQKMTVCHYC